MVVKNLSFRCRWRGDVNKLRVGGEEKEGTCVEVVTEQKDDGKVTDVVSQKE